MGLTIGPGVVALGWRNNLAEIEVHEPGLAKQGDETLEAAAAEGIAEEEYGKRSDEDRGNGGGHRVRELSLHPQHHAVLRFEVVSE